jgi:hypothetical protein
VLTYQQKVKLTCVTPASAMFFRLRRACGESYANVPSKLLPRKCMPRWSGHGGAAAPASPPVLPLPPPPPLLLLLPTVDVTAADRARASSSAVGHRGGSAQADTIVGRRVEPLRRGGREQHWREGQVGRAA